MVIDIKNFQKFTQFFIQVKDDFNDTGNVSVHYDNLSVYDKLGITDKDKIKQLEIKKVVEAHDRMELGVSLVNDYGSVYELEEDVMRYVSMNRTPPKDIIKKLKLPFKCIFIETEISSNDVENLGVDKISGMLIQETSLLSRVETGDVGSLSYNNLGRVFLVYYLCEDGGKYWIDEFKIVVDSINDLHIHYSDKDTMKFLRKFLMNFILFINDPEVEWVYHKRDENNVRRRLRKGKPALPSSRKVRVIGKLKKYMDGIRNELTGSKFNFRFWVSGHYRTLSSDKYTRMKGKVIRIEPYQKGQGMLLKRTYELKFEGDDDRKPDDLTMGDIK